MRTLPAIALFALVSASIAFSAPVCAAGLSLARFVPRIELGAMFELERASPAGTTAVPQADETDTPAPVDEDRVDPAARADADTSLAPPRSKPGAAGQDRAPRWKSLIPGALK